jgi:hypothetical protein
MLRLLFLFSCTGMVIFSCKEKPVDATPVVVKGITAKDLPVAKEKIRSTFTGDFKGSPIAITFRYLSGNRISGYNIHKGLKRNVTGTIALSGSQLHIELSEPGTNPYDGYFDLWIDTLSWRGRGRWKPMEKGEDVSFTFRKQDAPDYDNANIFSYYEDSLRNSIELKEDGFCLYHYIVDSATQQQALVRGNFKLEKDSTLNIFWQKNDVFPSGRSTFRMRRLPVEIEDDFWVLGIVGEGRAFTQIWD